MLYCASEGTRLFSWIYFNTKYFT